MKEAFVGVHPLYSVMAFVCALSVLVLMLRIRLDGRKTQNLRHYRLYCWTLFFCIQDGIWGLFAAHTFNNDTLLFAFSTIFHLSSAFTTYVWVNYFLRMLRKRVKHPHILRASTVGLVLVQFTMLAVNIFNKFMFYIDSNGEYTTTGYRKILFFLQFAVYFSVGVVCAVKLMRSNERELDRQIIAVFCINASSVLFGVFQMWYPDAPANSAGFSIGCIVVYSFIAAEQERRIELLEEKAELQNIIEQRNKELKKTSETLAEALIKAESANEAKSTFLFNMSHDIRTPMNAIIGYTDMALKQDKDEKLRRESLEKIKSSSEFLLCIINDVLDMARIESGKVKIEEDVVNVSDINRELSEMIIVNAAAKNIEIVSETHQVCENYIWADKHHVNQIMTNLLSNAIKYTPAGGTIWHSVRQEKSNSPGYVRCVTTIKDTGIGMSKEFQAKIFDEFEREKNSTVSGIQGTGLGMSIVKKLVDLMNGEIHIESELGKGTTIDVIFEHKIATEDELGERLLRQSTEVNMEEKSIRGLKVLLVEDNDMNREIAGEILSDNGIVVDTAEDGDVALEKVRNSKPGQYDLVLMDVQMPRMNGYEATRAIRQLEDSRLAGIPIIAMTANAFDEDRKNAMEAGMNGHLAKPIDVPKMIHTLSEFSNRE